MPTPRYHPFIRLLLFAAGFPVSLLLAAGVVGALFRFAPPTVSQAQTTTKGLIITLVTHALVILWMWYCRRAADLRSFESLGLRSTNAVRDTFTGLACGAAAITFLFAILLVTGFVQIGASTGQIWSAQLIEGGLPDFARQIIFSVGVFIAVGFVEELVFRGYAFQNLIAWMNVAGATVVQAFVFAAIHLGNVVDPGDVETASPETLAQLSAIPDVAFQDAMRAMPGIFSIGVFFALCYLKTGSLWFPIGFHIAWNFFLGCIFSAPVSGILFPRLLDVSINGSPWITGGSFGLEGSLLLLPITCAMIYVLLRQPDHRQAQFDIALLRPPRPQVEEESDEPHIPRYRTSMRSNSQTLEPEIVDSLRQLSEAKAKRREESLLPPPVSTPAAEVPGIDDLETIPDGTEPALTGASPSVREADLSRAVLASSPVTPAESVGPARPPTRNPGSNFGPVGPPASTAPPTTTAWGARTTAEDTAPEPEPVRPALAQPGKAEPAPTQPPAPKKPPAPRW